MSPFNNNNPPQTFARLFRPWEIDTSAEAEGPLEAAEAESPAQNSDTSTLNGNITAKASANLSSGESDPECDSSSSSCSKTSSCEESFNKSDDKNNLSMTNSSSSSSSNSPATTNYGATVQAPYTNAYFYGSMEAGAPHFATRFQPPNVSYMLPSATNLYYAAAAAAVAANNDIHPAGPGVYALNSCAFNFMDREYARVMVEEAQLKAANARKQRPKKFKCTLCNVAFSNNGQLKGHIRIHTGERPFKCDFETCEKTFTRNEELTRHKRIHTGLKPYPCPVCGKCFGRRDHLSKHLKTHMPKSSSTMYLSLYPDYFSI